MRWIVILRLWLHLVLCTISFAHAPPQDELGRLLEFIRNQSQQVLALRSETTAHHLAYVVKTRIRCANQGLTNKDCLPVLGYKKMMQLSSLDAKNTTNSDDIKRLSVVLAYHVINLKSVCQLQNSCGSYEECRLKLFQQFGFKINYADKNQLLEPVEVVLKNIQAVYQPVNRSQCFGAESVLPEGNSWREFENGSFENLMQSIMIYIFEGHCIVGAEITDFMNYLFDKYGGKCAQVIPASGIEEMLEHLKNPSGHHEDHDHKHHDHDDHDHEHHDHDHEHHDHDHGHHDHDHGHHDQEDGDNHHDHEHDHKYTKSLAEECLDAATLLEIFTGAPDQNITHTEFLQLCPALVQQAVSDSCRKSITRPSAYPSTVELYGYSSLAVLLISLCALCGIFLLPISSRKAYQYVMMGFISLAFGAMAGDALLHLIPQALGLHSHDHDHDHDHENESIPSYLWRQLGVIVTIYGLFMFELIMERINNKDEHCSGHSHCQIPERLPGEIMLKSAKMNVTDLDHYQSQNSSVSLDGIIADSPPSESMPVFKSKAIWCGLTSFAMVVTIGDTFHNFGDGLAIGAAFSSGLKSGLSTSLAIFFHELPQELGDFAILVSTGLSFKKALLINFLSALSCFGGLYIGIQLGGNETARAWVFLVTAGIFLYVALVDMLPELKQPKHGSSLKMIAVKSIGALTGIAIMMIIAVYEEQIHV